jgi:hypothetical protein
MSNNYNGVGYPGDLNLQGEDAIQAYLQSVGQDLNAVATPLITAMQQEEQRITGSTANNYTESFFVEKGIPRNISDFVVQFRTYLYEKVGGTIPPAEQNYWVGTLYTTLKAGFSTITNQGGTDYDPMDIDDAVPSQFSGSDTTDDLFVLAFNNFAKTFVYTGTSGGTFSQQYSDNFSDFLQRIVEVQQDVDVGARLSYAQILQGFTGGTLTPEIFNAFVQKMIDEKGYFTPSSSFDKWVDNALSLYIQSYTGSPSQAVTSVGTNSGKTFILNRIFALLVMVIESLQKVTASQSNRLTLFSQWQTAYADLQNQIKYIIKDDPNFRIGTDENRKNEYNQYTATMVETIKARKSGVGDDSKNLQTQVNQSNDAVNQQVSMATSILQELATILSALYK